VKLNHLQGAQVGKFIIGTQNDIDIWELLKKNILGPYGITLYLDRSRRQICADYVGEPLGDGVIDDYVAITEKHIKGTGDLDNNFRDPIRAVELEVRAIENKVVGIKEVISGNLYEAVLGKVPALFGGATTKITINPREMESAFSDYDMDSVQMSALFNTEKDAAAVVARLTGLLGQYVVPPPVWSGPLDIELFPQLHCGSWVIINWNTPEYPVNPLTGQQGWTNVVGRVTRLAPPVGGGLTFDVSIELFQTILGGRVAPATQLVSSGNDGHGDYFTVTESAYSHNAPLMKDWWFWEVGDVLEWRSESGARKTASSGTGYTITGFGTGFASTPDTAVGNRIYVAEAITPMVFITDYLTFFPWEDGQADRKELYSALADATLTLGAAGDLARRYA
jgi:hypothetical protein